VGGDGAASRLRLRALPGSRRPSVQRRRRAARAGYPECWCARCCRTPTTPALAASRGSSTRCSPATKWPDSSRPRRSSAFEEPAGPRGEVGRQADEGEGVRAGRQTETICGGRRRKSACLWTPTSRMSSRSCGNAPASSGCGGALTRIRTGSQKGRLTIVRSTKKCPSSCSALPASGHLLLDSDSRSLG